MVAAGLHSATMLWFCVLGGSAMDAQGTAGLAGSAKQGAEASLLGLLDAMPGEAVEERAARCDDRHCRPRRTARERDGGPEA